MGMQLETTIKVMDVIPQLCVGIQVDGVFFVSSQAISHVLEGRGLVPEMHEELSDSDLMVYGIPAIFISTADRHFQVLEGIPENVHFFEGLETSRDRVFTGSFAQLLDLLEDRLHRPILNAMSRKGRPYSIFTGRAITDFALLFCLCAD